MEKIQMRKAILEKLKSQDRKEKASKDAQLLSQILASQLYKDSKVIGTYLAFDFEYDSQLLINQAQKDGKVILVPKTYPQGKMIFIAYDENDLEATRFGLLEPRSDEAVDKSKIDLIHVPGLLFNERGFRIGYGGGYYDRYLSDYGGHSISTIYDFQKSDFLEDQHDIAVKEVFSK